MSRRLQRMTLVVLLYQVIRVYVLGGLPCIVRRWIALPFDQILQLALTPMTSVVDNGLDLVLLFALDQIRWWTRKVGPVDSGLSIGQEKRGVKHVMDAPGQREGESVSHWRYYLANTERSLTSGGQLRGVVR